MSYGDDSTQPQSTATSPVIPLTNKPNVQSAPVPDSAPKLIGQCNQKLCNIYDLGGLIMIDKLLQVNGNVVANGSVSATSTTINGVSYTWPLSNPAGTTYLTNNGSNVLTFTSITQTYAQMVSTTTTSSTDSTSTSFIATTLAGAIVPTSASNRIKVTFSGTLGNDNSATNVCELTIKRNGTDLAGSAQGLTGIENGSIGAEVPVAAIVVDAPASTSNTQYVVYMKATQGAVNCRFDHLGSLATMTMEEIK